MPELIEQDERCLPHARGGVSREPQLSDLRESSSPRPWGCFRLDVLHGLGAPVFPTPVGVFPDMAQISIDNGRLPHARGGVSIPGWDDPPVDASSPRPWGCFRPWHGDLAGGWGLPHARGGVSFSITVRMTRPKSSPRPWGCFWRKAKTPAGVWVFPTSVGVFLRPAAFPFAPKSLPHARGGVS